MIIVHNSLIKTLQSVYGPVTTIEGALSYFEKHYATARTIYSELTTSIDTGEISFTVSDDQVVPLSTKEIMYNTDYSYTTISAIKTALNSYLSKDTDSQQLETLIPVHVIQNGVERIEQVDFEHVCEIIGESNDMFLLLLSTLQTMRNCIVRKAEDFYEMCNEALSHIDIRSVIKENFLTHIYELKMTVGEINHSNLRTLGARILTLFGITGSKDSIDDSVLCTYKGINAVTAIAADALHTSVDVLTKMPAYVLNVCTTILYSLVVAWRDFSFGVAAWIADRIMDLSGSTDAFTVVNEQGDGSVAMDYSYRIPVNIGGAIGQQLANIFATLETDFVQALYPTGYIICSKGESYYDITFIPILYSYDGIALALSCDYGIDLSYFIPWRTDPSLYGVNYVSKSPNFDNREQYNFNMNEQAVCDVLENMFTKTDNHASTQHVLDSVFFMSVLTSQFLTIVLGALWQEAYSNDPWDDTAFRRILKYASDSLIYSPVLQHLDQNGRFEITNQTAGIAICSMQSNNSAFACDMLGTNFNSYNQIQISTSYECGLLWAFLNAATLCYINTSVADGTGVFLPYSTRYIEPIWTWAIPSDQDNYDKISGLLKRGMKIVGAIAIVVVSFIILRKIKLTAYSAAMTASQLSFDAAATGNTAMMNQSYKLYRRAKLLGVLTGVTTDIVSQAPATGKTTSTISNEIKAVGRLIKPDF